MSLQNNLDIIHSAAYNHENYKHHIDKFFGGIKRAAGNERIDKYLQVTEEANNLIEITFLGRTYRITSNLYTRPPSEAVTISFGMVSPSEDYIPEKATVLSEVQMNSNGMFSDGHNDSELMLSSDSNQIATTFISWLAGACNA
jgi:hypothetical protein